MITETAAACDGLSAKEKHRQQMSICHTNLAVHLQYYAMHSNNKLNGLRLSDLGTSRGGSTRAPPGGEIYGRPFNYAY